MPVPPALSFRSLGYKVIKLSYFIFLALSSSKNKTMVYSVDRIVVDKAVDGIVVNKEVNGRAVKQGVFK